jgi:hypothetical protein
LEGVVCIHLLTPDEDDLHRGGKMRGSVALTRESRVDDLFQP